MIWQEKAECKGQTELFFPDDEDPDKDAKIEAAKDICASCPFRAECLELGLKEKFGVWAGTTPTERVNIRRQKRDDGQKNC